MTALFQRKDEGVLCLPPLFQTRDEDSVSLVEVRGPSSPACLLVEKGVVGLPPSSSEKQRWLMGKRVGSLPPLFERGDKGSPCLSENG